MKFRPSSPRFRVGARIDESVFPRPAPRNPNREIIFYEALASRGPFFPTAVRGEELNEKIQVKKARKFMAWATGLETRKLVLSQLLRRPAREDVDLTSLAPGMVPLSKMKLLKSYDEDYWIKEQPEVLQKVREILPRVK